MGKSVPPARKVRWPRAGKPKPFYRNYQRNVKKLAAPASTSQPAAGLAPALSRANTLRLEALKPSLWEKYKKELNGPLIPLIKNLPPANAQYQALSKKRNLNKKFYGNLPLLRNAAFAKAVNNAGNLTNKQKNALRRMIRSVRVNNMEKNKRLVRVGRNREKLNNALLKNNPNNAELLRRIKANVNSRQRRPNENTSNNNRNGPSSRIGGGNLGAPNNTFYNAQAQLNQHRRNYGN